MTGKTWKGLQKFTAGIASARTEEREVSAAALAAQSEEQRLSNALSDAMIDGRIQTTGEPLDDDGRKLHADLAAAKTRCAEPWAERHRAAKVRIDRAKVKRDDYVRDNANDLSAELVPGAEAWVERTLSWIHEGPQLGGEFSEIASSFALVLNAVPGAHPQDVPTNPLESIQSELERLRHRLVPPLPRSMVEDNDPVIRAA